MRSIQIATALFLAGTLAPAAALSQGLTLVESDRGSLSIRNRAQFRFTHARPDGEVQIPGTDGPGDSKGEFRVRRAKTELTGWVWRKNLTYELQLSWAGPEPGASTQTPLEDLLLTWDVKSNDRVRLTIGQF